MSPCKSARRGNSASYWMPNILAPQSGHWTIGLSWQERMDGSRPMIDPKLVQGNCIEVMSAWPSSHVDLIVSDPPYNLGKDYGNGSDSLLRADYLKFTKAWLAQAIRVLKPTGSIYVFMGFRFISHLYNMLEEEFRLPFNSWICWNYTQGVGRTRGFSPRHDDILFFCKSDRYTFNLDSVRIPQKY